MISISKLKQIGINLIINTKKKINETKSFTNKYKFEDRSNNRDTLCIILAGYKEFTWDIVFNRINEFSEKNMDICIVSSGLYNDKLSKIAKKNGWSYLSTKRNSVAIAQNTVIKLFPNANYIYKLDEDIFITKNFFKTLKETFIKVQKEGEYDVGFVAPILPINGFAHVFLLKKLNLINYYNKTFEQVKFGAGNERMIVHDPQVAKFMWGENGKVPHIDEINNMLYNSPFSYSAVTIRFSIGAILFHRELWENMGYYDVIRGTGLGLDEKQLCAHCMINSKGMIVSENSCVGHLSFQLQNKEMKEYFMNHQEKFKIKDI